MDVMLIKRSLLLSFLCHCLITAAYGAVPADYWQQFSKAKDLFAKNQFNDALPILQQLETSKPDYNIELVLGDTYSALGHLQQAIQTYEQALVHGKAVNNLVIERVSLFKMGRAQMALKQYQQAERSYQTLLGMAIDKDDKELASTGFNNAHASVLAEVLAQARKLIDNNEGKQAYQMIHPYLAKENNFDFTLIAGQSMAIMNEPLRSFNYFKQSLVLARNSPQKRIVLLGMVNMQLELKNLSMAQHYYAQFKRYAKGIKDKELKTIELKIEEQIKALKQELFYKKARVFLDEGEGEKCYDFIKTALYTEPTYTLYIMAAESMSIMNLPENALNFYQTALANSANKHEKIDALFGVGKMQFWLARYVRSGKTYADILQYHLSGKQYQQALAGLVKSEAYYDRPQKAYQHIPPNLVFTTPELVVAAAQASLWAGWSDKTKNIINQYQPLLADVNPKSGIGKDWRDATWQTDLATWPNELSPSFFASRDTETFHKKQSILDYRHYWSYFAQTSLGPEYIKYTQYNYNALDAKGFYLTETLNLNRYLMVQGKIEPMNYNNLTPYLHSNWNPFLWSATGSLKPNDYVSLNVFGQKEVIETFPAFAHHITDDQLATTLSVSPFPYLRLDSSFSRLNISDDNVRTGYFYAANLLANPDLGFSTIATLRGFSNQFKSPYYFSPNKYQERKLLFKLGRKMGSVWHYYMDFGFGRQYITPLADTETVSSPTYQWGAGVNGPITKHLLITFYYINTHQASAFLDSSGYAYQCGGLSFNILT
jgi:tetratricopeptide (TPR) repeat protein